MRRRFLGVSALSLLILTVTAAPAVARDNGSPGDRKITISGDVVVPQGQTVHGPVITVDGNATINGTVDAYVGVGDGRLVVSGHVTRGVVVVHGDAHISGRVGGDVVALSGRVFVTAGAHVGGDVVSQLAPRVAKGTVAGDVKRVDLGGIFTGLIIGFLAFLWLAVTLSIAITGLIFVGLFPRAADTAAAAGKKVGASIGWGALIGIVGPLVAGLVFVTVLGIPLGLGMLGALNLLAPLGYVTTALVIGRLWVKGTSNGARFGAFFAGFGILRLIALLPGLGLLVWLLACIYGIGAVSMAAWHGGRRRDIPPETTPPETTMPETTPPETTTPEPPAPEPPAPEAPEPETAAVAAPSHPGSEPEPPRMAWSPDAPSPPSAPPQEAAAVPPPPDPAS